MKPNEAPKKLYFGESDKGILDIYSNRESNDEVEYTRTDAFIEKACEWIKEKWDDNYTMPIIIDSVIDEFKNHMKGEEV